MESDLAWAPTHTLTRSRTEVVDHSSGPVQSSLPDMGAAFDSRTQPITRWAERRNAVISHPLWPHQLTATAPGHRRVGELGRAG